MELPNRKHPRLKEFDYGAGGVFSVTICAENKKCVFGRVISTEEPWVELSQLGMLVKHSIHRIPDIYPGVCVMGSVIMPNHVHMLLEIKPEQPVSLFPVIRSTKAAVTKQWGASVWQRSFYEHIVRSEEEGLRYLKYMDENPIRWTLDEYYTQ